MGAVAGESASHILPPEGSAGGAAGAPSLQPLAAGSSGLHANQRRTPPPAQRPAAEGSASLGGWQPNTRLVLQVSWRADGQVGQLSSQLAHRGQPNTQRTQASHGQGEFEGPAS